jgi:2-dehydro-3-deoxy-D-arabinonate dehydratase
MQFGKIRRDGRAVVVGVENGQVVAVDVARDPQVGTLSGLIHSGKAVELARELIDPRFAPEPLGDQVFLAPIDRQEVWAAGVTYRRSKVAREEESRGAAQFYDKVYTADRPELFLKATPERVVDPGEPVRVRADSKWSVPEPELALVISPAGTIVGFTIGNDMSARDIEGENPLYLPQAKIYRGSCAVGPLITPVGVMPELAGVEIRLDIERGGSSVFSGRTTLAQMARTPESLASWLFRENEHPHGAVLLTGTGIVPPDEFTLQSGDVVVIAIAGIGALRNPVA